MVMIENDLKQTLKMSLNRYKETGIAVYQKAKQLEGKKIIVRTSKNTGNWSSSEWFSELKIDGNAEKQSIQNTFNENKTDEISEKNRCLSCKGKGFYLYAEGLKRNTCSNCEGTGIRAEARQKEVLNYNDDPPNNNYVTREATDYSNSPVAGDLGYTNTKFWNGY